MSNVLFKLLMTFMILGFSIHQAIGAGDFFAKPYPLPMAEMRAVVIEWLSGAGFELKLFSPQSGQVDINARKGQQVWQLSLTAHSPLATWVRTLGIDDGKKIQPLWNHIERYLQSLTFDGQQAYGRAAIPSAVVSRVGTIACIKTTEGGHSFQFSGFAISRAGAIICTAHDLNDRSKVSVELHDGRELEGRVVKLDAGRDLAIVLVESQLKDFVDLGNGRNNLQEHERLFSVGCPMNVFGVIQPGVLSGAPRRLNGFPLWLADMVMHPGSSGSPVFDAAGNLVAIIKGRYRGTDSLGLLIPFETLLDFVREY